MFFPIRDDQPRFSAPVVNYFIIALNIAVFIFIELPAQFQGPRAIAILVSQYGLIPHDLTRAFAGTPQYPLSANLLTILTSMFLHGGWQHILGNMWILWIFGDNVEDHMGHFPYLVFYLLCGVVAALTDFALSPLSTVPMIGASGAIAGVIAAHLVLYPGATLGSVAPVLFLSVVESTPTLLLLLIWLATQVLSGVASLTTSTGIAWWAHLGGFASGLVLAPVLRRHRSRGGIS